MTTLRSKVRRLRAWYSETWWGRKNEATNGRLMVVSVAVLVLAVFVPYSLRAEARHNEADRRELQLSACQDRNASTFDIVEAMIAGIRADEKTFLDVGVDPAKVALWINAKLDVIPPPEAIYSDCNRDGELAVGDFPPGTPNPLQPAN